MNNPISETANFAQEGEIIYNSQDYGTGAPVSSSATFTGPSGSIPISYTAGGPSGATWVIPGTYTVSYSTDQYGANVYSAPSSVIVFSEETITATYYTPTSISCTGSYSGDLYVIYGQVSTVDGGNVGSGLQVTVYWYENGQQYHQTVTTYDNGLYQYSFKYPEAISSPSATFNKQAGYLKSSS
ncbi:MAG: hypothetical protein QW292_04370 [Candidatus Parvarchaeota archaeon]